MTKTAKATIGHNGIDIEKAKPYLTRVLRLKDEMKQSNSAFRNDIKQVYAEAKDEIGIPSKALKEIIVDMERAEKIANLDEDTRNFIDDLRAGLGDFIDTPLGQASLDLNAAE